MEIFSKLNTIKETIKSTSDLSAIKNSLSSASTLLLSSPLLDSVWEQAYGQFTTFLLDNVFVDWVSCFTTKERETLFDSFFIHAPSYTTPLLAITDYVFSPNNQFMDKMDKMFILEYVEEIVSLYYVRKDYVCKLIVEGISAEVANPQNGKLDPKWEQIVSIIGSLPERFNNKMEGKTSDAFLPDQYFKNIVRQLMEVVTEEAKMERKERTKIAAQVLSIFIAKIAKLGHSGILARELAYREKRWKQNGKEMSLVIETFASTPTVSVEAILDALLRVFSTHNSTTFATYISELLSSNETLPFLLEKFLSQRTYSRKSLALLMDLVMSFSTKKINEITKDCFAIKCTLSLLRMWSDTNFLQHTPIKRHRQITRAIQYFISKTDKPLLESTLLPLLVKGVQAHMQSPQRDIRVLGMKTAEIFSVILDPDKPLKFEEDLNDSDDELEELNLPHSSPPSSPPPSSSPPPFSSTSEPDSSADDSKKDVKNGNIDPNEEIGAGFARDAEEDDDDDLKPYDLEDDMSDLHPHAKQYYLRDCLAIFQQNSENLNLDVFKGAITSIERIVRAKPDDLDEVSEQLARSLLRARSEFSDEEFAESRVQALVALAVNSPTIVVGFLGRQFYETNYSLAQRMMILDVLVAAAKELSTISEAPVKQIQSPSDLYIVGKVTRKGTTQPKLKHTQNIAFYPLANLFIYPLMAKFDNKENSFNMLGEDSVVLSRLVYALGTFMECAGNSPHSRQIARDLFNFLWTIRLHKQAVVRRGVLFAISKIVQVLPPYMFMEDFSDRLDELQMWIYAIVNTDADDSTRVMAQAVMFKLVESMQANMSITQFPI